MTEQELRVAKALYAVENHGLTGGWDTECATPELMEYWLKSARAAIRASQTPSHAQAVTREEWAEIIYDAMSASLDEKITWEQVQEAAKRQPWQAKSVQFIYDIVDAVTKTLAEKPVPTPTPLTDEERELIADIKQRAPKDDLWPEREADWACGRAIACREDRRKLVAIIDRLSASPTAQG
jgi:hypothetical protein